LETNLVHQSGNGVLEALGDIDQAINIMTTVEIDNTLCTDSGLVSFAVRVDLILRMLLAVKNPGGRRGGPSLQGLVNGDVLMIGHPLGLEVGLLASITMELGAVGTLDCGLVLLTQLTPDIIRINFGTDIGSRHHTGSEVVGGEILNSPPWNWKGPWHFGHLTSLLEANYLKY